MSGEVLQHLRDAEPLLRVEPAQRQRQRTRLNEPEILGNRRYDSKTASGLREQTPEGAEFFRQELYVVKPVRLRCPRQRHRGGGEGTSDDGVPDLAPRGQSGGGERVTRDTHRHVIRDLRADRGHMLACDRRIHGHTRNLDGRHPWERRYTSVKAEREGEMRRPRVVIDDDRKFCIIRDRAEQVEDFALRQWLIGHRGQQHTSGTSSLRSSNVLQDVRGAQSPDSNEHRSGRGGLNREFRDARSLVTGQVRIRASRAKDGDGVDTSLRQSPYEAGDGAFVDRVINDRRQRKCADTREYGHSFPLSTAANEQPRFSRRACTSVADAPWRCFRTHKFESRSAKYLPGHGFADALRQVEIDKISKDAENRGVPQSGSGLLPESRREKILDLVEQHGFARVAQLSKFFGVSEVTIRTDLDVLAETRMIQRVHGGVVSGLRSRALERPFERSMMTSVEEKKRIGRAAAQLVRSYQAVILDVGTTTTAIARALAVREDISDVVIITNALNIALEFEKAIPRFTVIVTGGTLRPEQHSLVAPLADMLFDRMQADVAFIGCTGVDLEVGVTNANIPEADMKRRMLQAAHRGVIVADSMKLGVTQLSRVTPLSEVHTLITGVEADPARLTEFREAGLEVITA